LDGLTTLSDEAAEALSKCAGYLCLKGLETLSPEAARNLLTHENLDTSLNLEGIANGEEEGEDRDD
ncbi:MAG: hypothetical protein P1U87_20745, partial [Verrucomicrobiales bacterium]|nr:hypothetical protein [Verrucomicrobiales bacterium]